jgi:galactokinase
MYGKQEQVVVTDTEKSEIDPFPAWQMLDLVVRQWVALSGFEKDQEEYQKRRKLYQD